MLRRELTKGKSTVRVTLSAYENERKDNGVRELFIRTKKRFDAAVAKASKAGFKETQRSLSRRAFYFGKVNQGKFWIIELDGESQRVQYGQLQAYGWNHYIGTAKEREFEDEASALLDYHKKIEKKLREGYVEFHARKTDYAQRPEGLAKPKKRPKQAAAGGQRRFELVEGSSSKFWAIAVDGNSHTVSYGRIGTKGQTKTKSFADGAAATKDAEKLIGQKTRKGYKEVTVRAKDAEARPVARRKRPAAVPAEVPAAAEAAPVVEVSRDLGLSAAQWAVATWRDAGRIALPQAAPFDRDDCLERIKRAKPARYGGDFDWSPVEIPLTMQPEEARFWVMAMTWRRPRDWRPTKLARELKNAEAPGSMTLARIRKQVTARHLPPQFVHPLCTLLELDEVLDFILKPPKAATKDGKDHARTWQIKLIQGLQRRLPYVTKADRKRIRDRVKDDVTPANDSTDNYVPAPGSFYLAAAVGLHRELAAVIEAWPDDSFGDEWSDHYRRPQDLIFGLGEPGSVEHHLKRLKLRLKLPRHVAAWLAHTELGALDVLVKSLNAIGSKEEAKDAVEVFARARAPEVAPAMLQLKLGSKAAATARDWLDHELGNAIHGLVPVAVGQGRLAEAAIEYLRAAKRSGHEAIIRAAVKAAPADAAKRVQRDVLDREEKVYAPFDGSSTPPWLRKGVTAADKLKPPKLPRWADPAALPPLVVGDHKLDDDQIRAVLIALSRAAADSPPPLLVELRKHVDRATAAAFAWQLFTDWIGDGAPSKLKWALIATGLLGDDTTALKLAPLIRAWPGESQHARAVLGLSCLRAIGTDVALMQLNGIAQKVKFKGLKGRAREYMEEIAKERKMTRAQLEDRIVPDCGLDENGTRTFDFGPRTFTFVLGAELKPMIKDADGKVRKDLPKPGAKDDAAKAEAAVAEWKLLKKQLREVGKIQVARLEQAMVTGRSWSIEEFESLLVRHPLMTNFARLVIWGGSNGKGKRVKTFRVTDERDYADAEDEETTLDGIETVRILHPLELTDAEKAGWGEVFGDYELIPPFPQLGRDTYGLEKGEAGKKELVRFAAVTVPALALVGTLDRLGWLRGSPEDAGVFYSHSKPFYAAEVTAIVTYPGVPIGYMDGWEDQKIEAVYFLSGIVEGDALFDRRAKIKLSDVEPIVLSEVLRDLTQVAAKGTA